MSTTPQAVFLSYASQDASAVEKICAALRAAGVEVWFDQSELVGGDAWDGKIRGQIKSCVLFVPVISASTQARREGYFRIEWKLAAQRTHAIADGTPFLLPLVIDDTRDPDALVPEEFRAVQWTRLPGGETSEAFSARVRALLDGNVGRGLPTPPSVARRNEAAGSGDPALQRKAAFRLPATLWIAGVVVVGLLVAGTASWLRRPASVAPDSLRQAAATTPSPATPPSKPASAEPGAAVAAEKSIAVLAFDNRSEDKSSDSFSDGMSEELLNVLSKVPGLTVKARNSSFYFKGRNATPQEIGRQLGVSHFVSGSVQKLGDSVRIFAQLSRTDTGDQIWTERFNGELDKPWELQERIAGRIAEELKLKLGVSARAAKAVNPEAHRLMLEGWHFWHQRSEEGFAKAETAFHQALQIDPRFARAFAGLANNHVIRGQYHLLDGIGDARDEMARAREAARSAIDLDPSVAEAHAALAYVLFNEGRWAESEKHFATAFELNPNYAVALLWHSQVLGSQGRFDLALVESLRAVELDPLAFIVVERSAEILRHAGHYAEGLDATFRAGGLRAGVFLPNLSERALLLSLLGRGTEAVAVARTIRSNRELRTRWMADGYAIWTLAQAGLREEAEAHEREVSARASAAGYARGFALAALGRYGEALPFLEKCPPVVFRRLYGDPLFDPFREDPRFGELLAKLGCSAEYKLGRETLKRMRSEGAAKR